jgi:hypothetical protein
MSFVYVIGAAQRGPLKIGVAADPEARVVELQTGYPRPLRIHHSVKTGSARLAERYAHRLLHEKRLAGEWFQVALPDAVAAVSRAIEAVARGEEIPAPRAPQHTQVRNMTGADFKAWRARLGLTQQAAADALGIALRTAQSYDASAELPLIVERACRDYERESGSKRRRK